MTRPKQRIYLAGRGKRTIPQALRELTDDWIEAGNGSEQTTKDLRDTLAEAMDELRRWRQLHEDAIAQRDAAVDIGVEVACKYRDEATALKQ